MAHMRSRSVKLFSRRSLMSNRYFIVLIIASCILLISHLNLLGSASEDEPAALDESYTSPPASQQSASPNSLPGKSWRMSMEWSNSLFGHLWKENLRGTPANPAVNCPQVPIPKHHVGDEDDEESDSPAISRKVFRPNGNANTLRPTKLLKHAPGWTIYENIYMAGGTFFLVTDDRSPYPPLRMMASTPLVAENTPENIAAREPTDEIMQFMTVDDAKERWGDRVWPVEGMTLFANDPPQFLSHYYHFAAETFFGMWRMYSSLDSTINVRGETSLEPPSRFIFGFCTPNEWRDYSTFNQFILHGAFPSMGIEVDQDWHGRSTLTATNQRGATKVWRFDRLLLADRSSSFRGDWAPGRNQRIAAEAWVSTRGESSKWWWEPVRRAVLRFAGVEQRVIDIPVMWAKEWDSVSNGDVKPTEKEIQVAATVARRQHVVITYIVRSGNRRSLIPEDHKNLVAALTQLCHSKKWELNVAHAERMTREEQIQLAAKTTVMLGIHGNGLTHLIWMPLTPISTVIEIFIPGGFAKDYEWTSRALGMRHYAVWNDTYFTHPNEPRVDYPEGFQGNQIPAHGPSIAKLIEDRVEGRLP